MKSKYKATCWYIKTTDKDTLIPLQVDFEAEEIENNKNAGAVYDLAELKLLGETGSISTGSCVLRDVRVWRLDRFGFWKPLKIEDNSTV